MREAMQLFFLRHGRADRDRYDGFDDDLRPLVPEGRRRLRRQAEILAAMGPGIGAVISSPLVRAAQTAEIMADRLGLLDALYFDDRLGPGCGLQSLAGIIGGLDSQQERIMLVGHEPDFSWMIGELVGGADVVMKKGALARVDLSPGDVLQGSLVWLMQPGMMLAGFSGSDQPQ